MTPIFTVTNTLLSLVLNRSHRDRSDQYEEGSSKDPHSPPSGRVAPIIRFPSPNSSPLPLLIPTIPRSPAGGNPCFLFYQIIEARQHQLTPSFHTNELLTSASIRHSFLSSSKDNVPTLQPTPALFFLSPSLPCPGAFSSLFHFSLGSVC